MINPLRNRKVAPLPRADAVLQTFKVKKTIAPQYPIAQSQWEHMGKSGSVAKNLENAVHAAPIPLNTQIEEERSRIILERYAWLHPALLEPFWPVPILRLALRENL